MISMKICPQELFLDILRGNGTANISSHGVFKALMKENMADFVGISRIHVSESISEASIKKDISTVVKFSCNF